MNLPREQFKLLVMYLRTVVMLFYLFFRAFYVRLGSAVFTAVFLFVVTPIVCCACLGGCEWFTATVGKCLTCLVIWFTNFKQRFARRIGRQEEPQVNPLSTIHPGLQPPPRSRIIARFFSRPKVSSAATTPAAPAAPPAPRDLPLAGTSGSKRLPLDTPRDLPDTPCVFERVPLPIILQNVDTSLTDEAGLSYRRSSVKLVNSNYCAY